MTTVCTLYVKDFGAVTFKATINGVPNRTTAQWVDTMMCLAGDTLLAKRSIRSMMLKLDSVAHAGSSVKEVAGVAYYQDQATGAEAFVIDPNNPADDCVHSVFNTSLVPAGKVGIAGGHIHPGAYRDRLTCTVNGATKKIVIGRGLGNGMASESDWAGLQGFPGVVMDPKLLQRFGTDHQVGTLQTFVDNTGATFQGYLPSNSQAASLTTSVNRISGSCHIP